MRYILGAGAMARETLYLYRDLGLDDTVLGFIEEFENKKNNLVHGKKVYDNSLVKTLPAETLFIGAIGSPLRKRWLKTLEKRGVSFDTVVHPSAFIHQDLTLGSGSILCKGVITTCDTSIGNHTIINVGTTINHDCCIGDFVTISPGVHIAGRVTLEAGCFIGIGVTISNDIIIGKGSFIGAGSVVLKDIPPGVVAFGSPAKPVKEIHENEWTNYI